ncbi:uncharacterized protein [Argopecten irradians]|uniref:uncharacterized protein isoform X1 n=2 Tax=Argopecten irradians TaxID=31199 RepID=UPI00371B8345
MTEVAPQQEGGPDLQAALLFALRDNKQKEAIRLLKQGAGVEFRDQTGCYPLHYAGQKGYNDVLNLLLENGAKPFAWDNNGQTALHKAAMNGHLSTIVQLVARGSKVDIIDRTGRLPLEYAVRNKHVDAVKMLCQFGSEPLLLDWTWLQDEDLKKKKDMLEIARVIKRQLMCISGYKHGAIRLDVAAVSPVDGPVVKLKNTGVEVETVEGQELYHLFLSQTEEAYSNPPTLEPEEEAFGHLLQCQVWGAKVKTITLTVTVERALHKTEEVVLRPETKLGGVDKTDVQEVDKKQVTVVTLTVPLPPSGIYKFAMATREKKEVFKLSNEAVTLKPEVEPEAEIAIPAGTFQSAELSIKFVDTAPVNEDIQENEDQGSQREGPTLMTNVLDLSTSDGQQPSKDIEMKIPVTSKDKSEEFLVLTSSNPDPNLEEWIWEKLQAEIDGHGKAVFNISHFSIYAGASKKKVLEDEKNVKTAIRKSVLKMRKIHFLVMVEKPQPYATKTVVTILCGTPRKTKAAKKKLRSCECFDSGKDLFEVPEGQIFEIQLSDGLKDSSGNTNLNLIFKSSDSVSKRTFEITGFDTEAQVLSGSVDILSVMRHYPMVEVEREEGILCFRNMKTVQVKSEEYTEKTTYMESVKFNVRLARKDQNEEDEPSAVDELERKDKCIIPALKWKNLRETMAEVNPDEAFQLALQLALKPDAVDEIREQSSDTDFAFNIIRKWRYNLPGNHQAVQLQEAFLAIGKNNLAARMSSQGIEDEQRDTGESSSPED